MKSIICLLVLLASGNLFAADKTHTIRLLWGSAVVQTNLESEYDYEKFHHGLIYDYQFNSNWGFTSGVTEASSDFCIVSCYSGREVNYKSIQLSSKWRTQISSRWNIKAQLGLNRYRVKYFDSDYRYTEEPPVIRSTGVKAFVAVGLEFQTHNGVMFGFEVQRLPMDIIDVTTHNLTFGFSF